LSRFLSFSLALIVVLTASLAQAAPVAAAGAGPSAALRPYALGGLLGDLLAFLSDLVGWIGSLLGGGGGSKGGGSHPGGGPPHGGPPSPGPPPGSKFPPWFWDNDWDGKGFKSSRELWKKWYC